MHYREIVNGDQDRLNRIVQQFSKTIREQFGLVAFSLHITYLGDIKLSSLIVGDKNKGTGTIVMEALCGFADDLGRRIVLSPAQPDDRWGTTSRARLVKFYKRFGFYENKGRKKDFQIQDGMIRNPKRPIVV